MAEFNYKGIDSSGSKTEGTIQANSRKAALLKLKAKGIKPTKVQDSNSSNTTSAKPLKEKKSKTSSKKATAFTLFSRKKNKRNPKLALEFYKQLMELHESGLPIADSIRILSKRTSDSALKSLYAEIWELLSSGNSFAQALSRYPEMFDPSLVKVIEAAASTGNIAPILNKIIQYLEEQADIQKKILSSLSYPIFICLMAAAVVLFFIFYLLPQIRSMLDSLGGEMSWSARVLIDGSELFILLFPYLCAGFIVIGSSLTAWLKTSKGKSFVDRWILKFPLLGPILYYRSLYQTLHLITTLLENKIHTTECLKMAEKTLSNSGMREKFSHARQMVVEGVSFSNAFANNNILPALNIDILRVGEETGSLLNALNKIANSFRIKLTDKLQFATTFISSIALFFAFSLVALIALGIVTSIFQVSRSIKL